MRSGGSSGCSAFDHAHHRVIAQTDKRTHHHINRNNNNIAHRAGAQVVLLEKEAAVGGNSAKATSGINGWGTRVQAQQGVPGAHARG